MKKLVALALFVLVSCGHVTPWHPGVGSYPSNGHEWHSCPGLPFDCWEGYSCTRDGCEWCGDDDGVETRCTNGND